MYQTHKQILWGLTTSLIEITLLSQNTWSGRSERGMKHCFKSLKQIQTVLFAAMLQIDKNYSIIQFESDMKANLTKCSNQFQKLQTVVEIVVEDEIDPATSSVIQTIENVKCDEKISPTVSSDD